MASMASLILFSMLALTVTTIYGQSYSNNRLLVKQGSCPPPLPVDICSKGCSWDGHCLGISKCCPTSCGGSICSRPVTTRKPSPDKIIEKPGVCPDPSTGRWICSSTCIDDSDCTETRKCCQSRCGGFTCKKPQMPAEEVAPNNEVDVYSNNIPYDNNVEPSYHANRDNPFLFGRRLEN